MVRAVGLWFPATVNGDDRLYALNLFLMSAFMSLGLLMALRMARAIWIYRDRTNYAILSVFGGSPGFALGWPRSCVAGPRRCAIPIEVGAVAAKPYRA